MTDIEVYNKYLRGHIVKVNTNNAIYLLENIDDNNNVQLNWWYQYQTIDVYPYYIIPVNDFFKRIDNKEIVFIDLNIRKIKLKLLKKNNE